MFELAERRETPGRMAIAAHTTENAICAVGKFIMFQQLSEEQLAMAAARRAERQFMNFTLESLR